MNIFKKKFLTNESFCNLEKLWHIPVFQQIPARPSDVEHPVLNYLRDCIAESHTLFYGTIINNNHYLIISKLNIYKRVQQKVGLNVLKVNSKTAFVWTVEIACSLIPVLI